MKLYTRSGDDGTTGLFGGQRVAKDHPRIEAYGTVDELNATLGVAAASPAEGIDPALGSRLKSMLQQIQSRLFDIGADLATPQHSRHEAKVRRIAAPDVAEIERWIDEIDGGNDEIRVFVLPGGTELAARLHVARTVCRRAERAMIALSHDEQVTPDAIVYINRLSDLLFAMARRANKAAGVPDVAWHPAGD
jgi:cob(I)alamin adenosyltransferase